MENFQNDPEIQILKSKQLFDLAYEEQEIFEIPKTNILIGGMGGSAISGDYVKGLATKFKPSLKIEVCRDYSLPHYVDDNWFVIIISYSGNTNEALSLLHESFERKIPVIAVSSGGEIDRFCVENNIPIFKLQSGYQPRYAFPMIYGKLVKLVFKDEFYEQNEKNITLEEMMEEEEIVESINKLAGDAIPIILTAPEYVHYGIRFRCQLNENSKKLATSFILPEFNHNGIISLDSHDELKFHYIFIYSEQTHTAIRKQIEFLKTYLINKGHTHVEIKHQISSIVDTIILTRKIDYISYKLALKRKVDPISVRAINELKAYLKDSEQQ